MRPEPGFVSVRPRRRYPSSVLVRDGRRPRAPGMAAVSSSCTSGGEGGRGSWGDAGIVGGGGGGLGGGGGGGGSDGSGDGGGDDDGSGEGGGGEGGFGQGGGGGGGGGGLGGTGGGRWRAWWRRRDCVDGQFVDGIAAQRGEGPEVEPARLCGVEQDRATDGDAWMDTVATWTHAVTAAYAECMGGSTAVLPMAMPAGPDAGGLGRAPERRRSPSSASTRRGRSSQAQRAALRQRMDLWGGGWLRELPCWA